MRRVEEFSGNPHKDDVAYDVAPLESGSGRLSSSTGEEAEFHACVEVRRTTVIGDDSCDEL